MFPIGADIVKTLGLVRWFAIGLFCLPGWVGVALAAEMQDTRAWLSRIHQAAGKNSFQGTFVVSGGGSVSSVRIAHFGVGDHQYERIESLDGPARQVYRHNDWVHTVWPQTRSVQVEQRQVHGRFPGLLQVEDVSFADFYRIKRQPDERVAGFDSDVFILQPVDELRFGYRLWSEKKSGLLLRSDVIAQNGEVLETAVFSELTLGIKPQPSLVLRSMKNLDGYNVSRPLMQSTQLAQEGWVLSPMVPGFQAVSCVKRPLEGDDPLKTEVIQTVFSDGLTYVSMFIEPYSAQRHVREMQFSTGPTHTLAMRHSDVWVTVVGDVPVATLRAFFERLQRLDRVKRVEP